MLAAHFTVADIRSSSEFRISNFDKFTGKGPGMSAEQCQVSRQNDRLKIKRICGGIP